MSDPSNAQPGHAHAHAFDNVDPLILYSRSLHTYTLALWTESRRIAEEKARSQTSPRHPVSYQPMPSTEPTEHTKSVNVVEEKQKIEAAAPLTPSASSSDQIQSSS